MSEMEGETPLKRPRPAGDTELRLLIQSKVSAAAALTVAAHVSRGNSLGMHQMSKNIISFLKGEILKTEDDSHHACSRKSHQHSGLASNIKDYYQVLKGGNYKTKDDSYDHCS